MQLRQLEYVASLAQWKTMRKAAQHLYVSEATISQQIRQLEAELGISLFEREGRTLKLSSEGEKLLPFIQRILHARCDLEEQIAEMKVLARETLHLGIVPSLAWKFLPAILTSFHTLYPQIRLEVSEAPLTSLELAQSGAGILFLPRFVVSGQNTKNLRNLRFLTLAPDVIFPLGYACIYTIQHARPQWFQAFPAILQECCQVRGEQSR